eukprot:3657261-Rhodomonas_salina.1
MAGFASALSSTVWWAGHHQGVMRGNVCDVRCDVRCGMCVVCAGRLFLGQLRDEDMPGQGGSGSHSSVTHSLSDLSFLVRVSPSYAAASRTRT